MAIYKIHRRSDWTHLPNEVLEDDRVSWRARGLLAYLLSRPHDWRANADHLASISAVEGRKAVLTALKELEDVGYIVRRKVRDEGGKLRTVTDVYDRDGATREASATPPPPESPDGTPVTDVPAGHTGSPSPNAGAPDAGAPDVGAVHSSTRTENKDGEQEPPPPRDDTDGAPVDSSAPGDGGQDPPDEDHPPSATTAILLAEVQAHLDDLDRARLRAAGYRGRRRILTPLARLVDAGWRPRDAAAAVCRGALDNAADISAVLAARAAALADAGPPPTPRGAGPIASLPADVRRELDQQACAAATTDAGGIDPQLRRGELERLATVWHQQQAGAA